MYGIASAGNKVFNDQIVAIANAQHKLSEFTDRKNFKSYDELKKKLNEVLSGDSFASKSAAQIAEEEDRPVASAPKVASKPAPKMPEINDDDEDVMSYFEKIAQED